MPSSTSLIISCTKYSVDLENIIKKKGKGNRYYLCFVKTNILAREEIAQHAQFHILSQCLRKQLASREKKFGLPCFIPETRYLRLSTFLKTERRHMLKTALTGIREKYFCQMIKLQQAISRDNFQRQRRTSLFSMYFFICPRV